MHLNCFQQYSKQERVRKSSNETKLNGNKLKHHITLVQVSHFRHVVVNRHLFCVYYHYYSRKVFISPEEPDYFTVY